MAANIIFDQYRKCFTLNFDLKMCCIESGLPSIYLRILQNDILLIYSVYIAFATSVTSSSDAITRETHITTTVLY